MSFICLSKNICRKTSDFCRISVEKSPTGCSHTKCMGPQVGSIYSETISLVPIGTPKYSYGNKNGSKEAFY